LRVNGQQDPVQGSIEQVEEYEAQSRSGVPWLILEAVLLVATVALFVLALVSGLLLLIPVSVLGLLAFLFLAFGFYVVQPNQAGVLTLFGDYRGTDTTAGLRWANPFYVSRRVSLRVRNFTTATSKVNDSRGNPIEIAAVVVWKVVDTARASFSVDSFIDYVEIQAESAVRQLARSYPYDAFDETDVITLIGDTGEINDNLLVELQERASEAGVEILETRITDLAYAPEIAESMLRRQQAEAIVAARKKIVEGAVLMVRDAVAGLEEDGSDHESIALDDDRKATFAANLMTVIASDHPTNPVVNVGTLSR
jgi:regulator of protease activity HflC (stomatin/prohibitin superfamily)